GIDVAATERKLAAYAAQNASSISANNARASEQRNTQNAQTAAQKEQARLNRAGANRTDLALVAEREESQREAIDAVANGQDGEGSKVILKKSTARRTAAEKARDKQRQQQQQPEDTDHNIYKIQGLKPVVQAPPEKSYDPFGGVSYEPSYYTLQSHYEHPWLDRARTDPSIVAGGYDLREYYQRTMLEAFAGLGCFIDEEMGKKEYSEEDRMVATEGAAMAAVANTGRNEGL
ncbi:MAG: hypothetical protein Q9198_006763, partial [Flavoplaca austrocitrina]